MTAHIAAVDLSKSYWKGRIEVPVLRGVDLEVERGRAGCGRRGQRVGQEHALAHPGPPGRPDSGTVLVDGQRIDNRPERHRDTMRNQLFGFIFQFYHLLPELTALENVMMPHLIRHGNLVVRQGAGADPPRGPELLERVGLGHRLNHRAVGAFRRRDAARRPSPGHWRAGRRFSWPTSRRGTWTPAAARECSSCSAT